MKLALADNAPFGVNWQLHTGSSHHLLLATGALKGSFILSSEIEMTERLVSVCAEPEV